MGAIESVCDLNSQIEQGFNLDRFAADQVPEGLAFQQFHCDESSAVYFINFVDGADVGMVQGRRRLGFPLEPAQGLRVAGQFFRKKLEGHVTAELNVFRFVDHTHAPATDFAQYAVVGERLPERWEGGCHWR
jgi:hypothetical protein